MQRTGTYLALESRLGEPLDELVTRWRYGGGTWQTISDVLCHYTGISVPTSTLRGWFREGVA